MQFKKTIILVGALILLTFLLTSCGESEEETTKEVVLSTTSSGAQADTSVSQSAAESTSATLSEDAENETVKIDTYIILNDDKTTINGSGAAFSDSILKIDAPGSYSVKGTLTNGKIYVNISDSDKKVKLYLDGVDITCLDDAPIFIENCPKETVIILSEGSINTLTDSADREIPSDENADYATAVIYSKDDLQIEGTGTLNINAKWNKGIFTKNDLDIRGGTINIESADDGIRGKESVEISDGIINITSGGDGIRTSEEEEADKGNILISGGVINITSELDGIQAVKNIDITGGTFNITACSGSTGTVQQSEDFGIGMAMDRQNGRPGKENNRGGIFAPNSSSAESAEASTESAKGIKADSALTVTGGTFTISSPDDAIHGVSVEIGGGTFSLRSDDDGIHADESLTINDGSIDISFSYEGLEAMVITINGGTTTLCAEDDGLNAAGETSSATSSKMMGGMMDYSASCQFYMNGGYLFMNANGDGLDSNGDAMMKGGTVIVFGPTNSGNGALDYAGSFEMSGGTLLAVGASGMAQSISSTSENVQVLAFNCSTPANSLLTITDENADAIIGIESPKSYQTIIFATDTADKIDTYNVYSGGAFDAPGENGIYLEGNYTPGELLGSLSP